MKYDITAKDIENFRRLNGEDDTVDKDKSNGANTGMSIPPGAVMSQEEINNNSNKRLK